MAHVVLASLAVCAAIQSSGCVIPLDFRSAEGDNSPPVIDLQGTRPPPKTEFGPSFTWNQDAGPREFLLLVNDPDEQTLTIRMFLHAEDRSYSKKIEALPDTIPPGSTSTGTRALSFEVRQLCDELVNDRLGTYLLELYVSDRGFSDEPGRLRQPQPGGLRDNCLWEVKCDPPLLP